MRKKFDRLSALVLSALVILVCETGRATPPGSEAFCIDEAGSLACDVGKRGTCSGLMQVTLRLDTVPPSRTKVYLVRTDTAPFQADVTWDPAFNPILEQSVWLPCGKYAITMSAEMVISPGGEGSLRYDRAWRLAEPGPAVGTTSREFVVGVGDQLVVGALGKNDKGQPGGAEKKMLRELFGGEPEKGLATETAHLTITAVTAPSNDLSKLVTPDSLPLLAPSGGLGMRSVLDDALPGGVADLLEVLTEIIVERAQSYAAMKLKVMLKDIIDETQSVVALTRLKEEIDNVDFFNLAASGKALLNALLVDVSDFLEDKITKLPNASAPVKVAAAGLACIWQYLGTPAAERAAALTIVGRTVILAFLQKLRAELESALTPKLKGTLTPELQMMGIIGAGVAYCARQQRCELREVWAYLDKLATQQCAACKDKLSVGVVLAMRGANLLADISESDARERLREAADWVLDVAVVAEPKGKFIKHLQRAVAFVDAVLASDGRQVALAIGGIIVTFVAGNDDVKRLAAVISSFGPLLAEPPASATPEERAAAREDKKRAIGQLIDSATDRRNRKEREVWAIQGTFGLFLGPRVGPETKDGAGDNWAPASPLSVGLGIGHSWLPNVEDVTVGGHLGLSVFDLGQLLRLDGKGDVEPVRVGDVLAPGIQGGFLFGDPEMPVALLLDARVGFRAPTDEKMQPYFQFGLLLGIQVPLFDFN